MSEQSDLWMEDLEEGELLIPGVCIAARPCDLALESVHVDRRSSPGLRAWVVQQASREVE